MILIERKYIYIYIYIYLLKHCMQNIMIHFQKTKKLSTHVHIFQFEKLSKVMDQRKGI